MGEIASTPSFLSGFQTYYTESNNDWYMKAGDMYKNWVFILILFRNYSIDYNPN